MRLGRARDDEQAGGVAVEAVDDPRALLLPTRRAVRQQRLRERALGVPGAGVNDDTRRLVDDEEMLVLVRDRDVDLR